MRMLNGVGLSQLLVRIDYVQVRMLNLLLVTVQLLVLLYLICLQTRETRFRETSESVNFRVFLWAVVQLSVLILLGVGQSFYLRNFFIAKKLV